MNNFDEEEAELLRRLEEVRTKRKFAELSKPISILIASHAGAIVYLKNSEPREDVIAEYQKTPGRIYRSYEQQNAVPIPELANLLERISKLQNVTVTYAPKLEESIHDYLYAANYSVSLTTKVIEIKVKKGISLVNLRYVPGFSYNHESGIGAIPKIEGWRLHEVFKDVDSVEYTEEARDFILAQIKSRADLDIIAKMEDVPDLDIAGLKLPLKNYQKVAVKFFETNGFRGIDADEMGIGKTPTAIAIALHLKTILGRPCRTLIIPPASLKVNWIRELAKFTDTKPPYVLSGVTPQPYDIAHIIAEKPEFVIINYDIIGRTVEEDKSYTDDNGIFHEKKETRWMWIDILNICNFDLIIADEVHYIKNVDSQRSVGFRKLQAPRVIGLTGTPILNRPGEFWPILTMLEPNLFPSYMDFIARYTWNGKSARNVDELRTALRPLMIRRLKKDVIKELPPINRINRFGELSDKAKKLYQVVLDGIYEVMQEWSQQQAGQQQSITNMLVKIMRLKQICAIDTIQETADLAVEIFDSADAGERVKKVLIFSQFKPTTYGIAQRLGDEALCFVERTESGEFVTVNDLKRMDLVTQFQTDSSKHFLVVTEKTAKEGLNITAAMAVIFNDLFWTPAAHQQAEGRAYGRVADLHPIDSYYMVKADTIMEWIQELLAAKMALIENVVEGVNASRTDESVAMELIKRLKDEMWTNKRKR